MPAIPAAVVHGSGTRIAVAPQHRRPPLALPDRFAGELAPEQRARLEAILAEPPRRRLAALIDADDADELVPAIPADAFAQMLLEVGPQDGDVLLVHAADEQLVHLVDLTVWDGDDLDLARTVELLEIFKSGDPEVCLRWLGSADNATILTLFAKLAVVTSDDVPLPPAFDELEVEAPFSLDGLFLVWTRAADHEGFLRWLLTLLFENHQQLYLWICQSLQWSLESDLQEEAHGMRTRRLIEHGFPPPAEAAEVFLPALPERLAPVRVAGGSTQVQPDGRVGAETEAIVAAPPDLPGGVPFLGRCSELLQPRERVEVRAAVDRLSRLVLAAELLDPGKPEDRQAALRRAARTVSIALEHLADGDPALGAALCLERPAVELFQVGHTLVAALHRRAVELKRDGWLGKVTGGVQLLEPELRRVFAACRHPRPQRHTGSDEDGNPRYEPYATLAEVAEARQVLEQIAAIGRLLVDGLGLPADFGDTIDLAGCLPSSWSEVSVGDILRTALVHGALGGGVRFAPVVPAELARFVSLAVEHRRLRASFRAEAVDVLLARLPADAPSLRATLEPYLAVVIDRLEEELGALDPSQPVDQRFVGGLVRRAPG